MSFPACNDLNDRISCAALTEKQVIIQQTRQCLFNSVCCAGKSFVALKYFGRGTYSKCLFTPVYPFGYSRAESLESE